jgi:hypothetical protein
MKTPKLAAKLEYDHRWLADVQAIETTLQKIKTRDWW